MSREYVLVTAVSAAIGMFTLGACGQATGGTPAPAEVAFAAERQATVSLNAAAIEGLGTVLTDQYGMTLYRFDEDSADPPTSTCDAECVVRWPPVLADGEIVVAGLDRELAATAPRVDGDRQVTIGGWPLYRFAGDRRPGDALGQGVDGAWHAATPTGGKAAPSPPRLAGPDLPGFAPALDRP